MSAVQLQPQCLAALLPTPLFSCLLQGNTGTRCTTERGSLSNEGRTFFPGVTTALFMERGHQARVKGYLFPEYAAYSNKAHTKSLWSALP